MGGSFQKNIFRSLRNLGVLGYRKKHNIYGINPIFISISYVILTLVLVSLIRRAIKKFVNNDSLVKHLLLEFLATLELCACCFELIIDNWGVTAYAISLFLLTLWWTLKWEDATACPYCPLEDIVDGTKTAKTGLYIICAQMLAGLCTFRYVQILWSLELVETHKGKAFEDCTADLQVDMIVGAVIECILTGLCRLVSRVLSEKEFKHGFVMDAIFSTTMVVLAFNLSGGYFNPVLATSLKLGCSGNTFVEHVVVYWIGACAGSILSLFIYKTKLVQNYCKKNKTE